MEGASGTDPAAQGDSELQKVAAEEAMEGTDPSSGAHGETPMQSEDTSGPNNDADAVATDGAKSNPSETAVKGQDDDDVGGETPSDDTSKGTDDNIKSADSDKIGAQDDKMDAEDDSAEKGNAQSPAGNEEEVNETAEDSSKELPYSTRGRSTATSSGNAGGGSSSGGEEKSSTAIEKVAETLEELSRPKETPGTSFLVESLTEEERRTRTRYIPDVEGMHVLRKNEVKDDIALARSLPTLVSGQGNIQRRAARLASSAGRRRDMDLDDTAISSNDDGTTTIELPTSELTVPSDVFVAPEGVQVGDNEGTIVVKTTESAKAKLKAPSHIETTVAFNPPRPPESIGAKKKHRVLRWERRPDDIEVDMKNYRRTVQRTRQELQKSEGELNRLEMIDAHLRRHFLNHLDLLREEHDQLREAVTSEIQKLNKFTGLAGSRTRNRNMPKPSVVMRDVLNILQKGDMTEVAMVDDPAAVTPTAGIGVRTPGIGGLSSSAFLDWDRSSNIKASAPAISWLEAGQAVKTPDGEGVVVAVIPIETPKDTTPEETKVTSPKDAAAATEEAENDVLAAKKKAGSTEATAKEEEEKKAAREKEHDKYKSVQPLRVRVRLSDRESVFNMDTITLADDPAHYSDKKLAKRWKGMIKSALQVGPCIDVEGLASAVHAAVHNGSDLDGDGNKVATAMDVEGTGSASGSGAPLTDDEKPLLPVNASLFPTVAGRGNLLHSMKIGDIENELHDALFDGQGVLGRKSNPGVTPDFRRWEEEEQEYLTLKASSLQLRNALYRQRRIRMLNERTASSMQDKYQRAEELVAEMRTDLKNLKRKLEGELSELGISEDVANQILSKFYKGQNEDDRGDASTPKRLKRASSMIRGDPALLSAAVAGAGKLSDDDDLGTDDMSGDDMDIQQPQSKKLRSG